MSLFNPRYDLKVKQTYQTPRHIRSYKNCKRGYRVIGNTRNYYRSRWEANFARYLEYCKTNGFIKAWEYEPQTFWFLNIKRGCRSYLPDFKIYKNDSSHYWVEIKGYMDQKSRTKINRFRKYYPNETLEVKDKNWYYKHSPKISLLCPDWERNRPNRYTKLINIQI